MISHGTADGQQPHVAEAMRQYAQTTAPFRPRSHAEVLAFFDGFTLISRGLVPVPQWRTAQPGDGPGQPEPIAAYGGAGIKHEPPAADDTAADSGQSRDRDRR